MTDVIATMAKKSENQLRPRRSANEADALHLCYGEIGISAVAAAARYNSGARTYAPAPIKAEEQGAAAT